MRTIPPWLNNIETTGRAFWTKIEPRKEVTFTPKLMKTSKSKKQYQDSHQYTVKGVERGNCVGPQQRMVHIKRQTGMELINVLLLSL